VPGHAEAPGVVHQDEIRAATLLEFRRDACAGSGTNDRLAPRDALAQAFEHGRPPERGQCGLRIDERGGRRALPVAVHGITSVDPRRAG
jgi:hypothetical protein